MKKISKKQFVSALGFAAAVLASAAPAMATPTFTLPDLPMTDYYTLMGTVVGGLAALWVGRKIIKTVNKS